MDLFEAKKKFLKMVWPILPRVDPNLVSLASIPINLLALYLLLQGNNVIAAFVFLFSQFLDLFDGAIARKYGLESLRGAAVDRIVDRVNDAIAIIGLALVSNKTLGMITLACVVVASYMSSVYEGFRKSREGEKLSKRWIRNTIIFLGMLLGYYLEALVLLLLIALYSMLQRASKIAGLP